MKILVLGATGDVGSRVVQEAISKGHEVTAIARKKPAKPVDGANYVERDLLKDETSTEDIPEIDIVISALRPVEGQETLLVPLSEAAVKLARGLKAKLVMVGGAARLKLPGKATTVLTEPGFLPENVVPIANACQAQLEMLESAEDIDWSYASPSAYLFAGEKNGTFRIGTDTLLVDKDGNSSISMEDFSSALVDEAEAPHQKGYKFTVGY